MRLRVYSFALLCVVMVYITSCKEIAGKSHQDPNLNLSDASTYNFGYTYVNETTSHTFTLSNDATETAFEVELSELTTPFSVSGTTCGKTLPRSTSCTITVVFSPTIPGTFTDAITYSYLNGNGKKVQIQRPITARGMSSPSLSISDASTYDFGSVTIGNTPSNALTLTNNSSEDISNLTAASLTNPFRFKGSNYPGTGGTCSTSLDAGSSCTVVVEFYPSGSGVFNDTLTMSFLYPDTSTYQSTRAITGRGLTVAALTISDGVTYDFGSIVLGTPTDKSFTITNTGESTATSISGSVSGAPYSLPGTGTCTTSLAGTNATCTVVARFTPISFTQSTDGLTLNYNNGFNTSFSTRPFTGVGIGAHGYFDTSFGTNGMIRISNLGFTAETTAAALISTDGSKLYVLEQVNYGSVQFPVVFRKHASNFSLDTTFNTSGFLMVSYGTNWQGNSLSSYGSNKLLIGGKDSGTDPFISRYLSNGQLDPSFGTGGIYHPNSTGKEGVTSFALQTNGSILYISNSTTIDRLLSNGTEDTTNGYPVALSYIPTKIGIGVWGAKERLIVTGPSYPVVGPQNNAYLQRIMTNGSYDTSFSTTGTYSKNSVGAVGGASFSINAAGNIIWLFNDDAGTTPSPFIENVGLNGTDPGFNLSPGNGNGISISLETDGSPSVLFGTWNAGITNQFSIFKVKSDISSLDTTFFTSGISTFTINAGDYPVSLLHDNSGRKLSIGYTTASGGYDEAVIAQLSSGNLDTSFDTDGKKSTNFTYANAVLKHLTLDTSGRYLIGAEIYDGVQHKAALVRMKSNGNLDTTFKTAGLSFTLQNSTITTGGTHLAIATTGNILLAHAYGLARFKTNGVLDTAFYTNGNYFDNNYLFPVIQTDGKVFVVGDNAGTNLVARFLSNGNLDTSFRTSGKQNLNIGSGGNSGLYSVEIQTSAKSILTGYASTNGQTGFTVLRLTTSGAFDTSFFTGGIVITTFSTGSEARKSFFSNNLVHVAGRIDTSGFGFTRYQSDGKLDTNFMTTGRVRHSFAGFDSEIRDMALTTDGGMFLIGGLSSSSSWAGIRVLSNGGIDSTFGTTGRFRPAVGTNGDIAQAIYTQSDGKFLIGGSAFNNNSSDIILLRLWP